MTNPNLKRRIIPYWLSLIIGLIIYCLVMNTITLSSWRGTFDSWTTLSGLPSGVKRILDAEVNQIWVESQDNRNFSASIQFNCEGAEMCWDWEPIDGIPEIPEPYFPVIRGSNCEDIQAGSDPNNPKGQIVECVYAHFPGPEFGAEAYFALMTDGSVLYWRNGSSLIATQVNFIMSTFVYPFGVAAIISLIYLVIHIFYQGLEK